jgi:CDGSH-type Zn-finger protein
MDPNGKEYRIKVKENKFYQVTGGAPLIHRYPAESVHGEPLEWDPVGEEEQEIEADDPYFLCRCGHSADKPFCDSSHRTVGFAGELTADRRPDAERRLTYHGTGVTMTDDESLCMDAGFCGTRFTKVWQMIEKTDDPEIRARLTRMVANCPSGRLEYSLEEGGEPVEPEYIPSIALVPDGPLWVRGGIPIEASDGFVYETRNRVTLCRCGESKNMPFCDGTHKRINFKAP